MTPFDRELQRLRKEADEWMYPLARPLLAVGARVYTMEIEQYGTILSRDQDRGSQLHVTYEVRLVNGGVLWFSPATLEVVSDLEYLAAVAQMKLP